MAALRFCLRRSECLGFTSAVTPMLLSRAAMAEGWDQTRRLDPPSPQKGHGGAGCFLACG